MDFGQAVITRAKASTPIAALVGTRIYWQTRPQGESADAIVFEAAGGSEDLPLSDSSDYFERHLNCHCYGATHARAWAIASAVRTEFADPATVEGFEFMDADISLPIDGGEDTAQGYVHDAVLDITIRHGSDS